MASSRNVLILSPITPTMPMSPYFPSSDTSRLLPLSSHLSSSGIPNLLPQSPPPYDDPVNPCFESLPAYTTDIEHGRSPRRFKRSRVPLVLCLIVLILIALLVSISVAAVVLHWGRDTPCVKWGDGSVSGECGQNQS